MGWRVIATMRYHRSHPDPSKRGKPFSSQGSVSYPTRAEAERQAIGSAQMDRKLGRKGVVYTVRSDHDTHPHSRSKNPMAKRRRTRTKRTTGKAAARKITMQIRKLKAKRRAIHRGRR